MCAMLRDWPQHDILGLPVVNLLDVLPQALMSCPDSSGVWGRLPPLASPSDVRAVLAGNWEEDDSPVSRFVNFLTPRFCSTVGLVKAPPVFHPLRFFKDNAAVLNGFKGMAASFNNMRFTPQLVHTMYPPPNSPSTYASACHWPAVFRLQAPLTPAELDSYIADLDTRMGGFPGLAQLWGRALENLGVTQAAGDWLGQMTVLDRDLQLDDWRVWQGCMRDHICLAHVPAIITTCDARGRVVHQNSASVAVLGVLGSDQLLTRLPLEAAAQLPCYCSAEPAMHYLQELLGSQELVAAAVEEVSRGRMFRRRVPVSSHRLRRLMRCRDGQEVHHDVFISQLVDGVSKARMYVVAQMDITEAVLAERQLQYTQQQQVALLQEVLPDQVINALLTRPPPPPSPMRRSFAQVSTPLHGRRSASTQYSPAEPSGHHRLSSQLTAPQLSMPESRVPLLVASRAAFASPASPRDDFDMAKLVAAGGGTGTDAAGVDDAALLYQASLKSSHSSFCLPAMSVEDMSGLATLHPSASLLFTEIEGFQSMSQKLHPSQVMLFLNHLYSLFDVLVEQHDVYKVETIGDCYMVASGLFDRSGSSAAPAAAGLERGRTSAIDAAMPASTGGQQAAGNSGGLGGFDPDHARKMMAFTKALAAIAARITNPLGEAVQMRLGVHTGPIMTGVVGYKMPRFCCFGDTVNTASRMGSTCSPGFIHVSQAFRDCVPEEPWVATGGVQVKGKGLMYTYRMCTARARPTADTPGVDGAPQ